MQYAVLGGLGFIFVMTCLGAAMVFFFRGKIPENAKKIFLGFAAGVMIAASVWSLLIPAIEESESRGNPGWLIVSVGVLLGSGFLYALDKAICKLSLKSPKRCSQNTMLLFTAMTLHNMPEGMAVGLSFALAAQSGNSAMLASAAAFALGIGIQNFPEGAAISLPLRQEGYSVRKSFLAGVISGAVEPVSGLLIYLAVGLFSLLQPWLLSFSAGAMLYVVVSELIPCIKGGHYNAGTFSFFIGFVIMMALDVALGG